MDFDLTHSTEKERSDKIDALLEQINALEDKISGVNEQIDQLAAENARYFARQETIINKNSKLRTSGGWLIFLGIAAAAVSFFFLKNYLTIGLIAGLCLAVFGIILCIGAKKYSTEYKSILQDLAPYYAQRNKHQEEIQEYTNQIENLESQIQEIADYGKQLVFNKLAGCSGHYLMIVTCEEDPTRIGIPKEPIIGKKYEDIQNVIDSLLYVDSAIYGVGTKVHGKNQNFVITYAKPAPGARSLNPKITYRANGRKETYPPYGDAPWVDGMTIYNWYHISINSEHSLVYHKTFLSLEGLCKTLKITKTEIVDNI